ncbi:MAG: DUF3999 domain-containing protein [Planctomycetes bacterium]|nr:DUF3999 domain-containing protein [Planctomycetota bacterium]
MKTYFLLPFLVLLVLPAGAAEPAKFRYVKEISRDKSAEEEIVSFTLDPDIYDATQNGLGDIRIFDGAGQETPYLLEPVVESRRESVRRTESIQVVSLEEKADTIEVRLQLGDKAHPIRGLSINSSLRDFVRKVQVFGSADGQEWTSLVKDGSIYDYSRYIDVRLLEIPLPENTFRTFKLVIDNVTDEKEFPFKELARTFRGEDETKRVERTTVERRPLRIDRISGWYEVAQERSSVLKLTNYPVAAPVVTQDSAKKQTIVTIATRHEPLTSFTLQTADHNFLRRATVEVQTPRQTQDFGEPRNTLQWTSVGSGTIFNIQFRTVSRQELKVPFSEQRQPTYRIVIENQDNPPIAISGVTAEGPQYHLLFLAKPESNYRVVYGSQQAAAPRYDSVTVLSTVRENNPVVVATLGPQLNNSSFGGEPVGGIGSLLNNWYFLGSAIGLMVVVLAWGLFRAGGRLENLPEE